MRVYRRAPLRVSRGAGSKIYDEADREYLDFGSGIAVNALGHNHPKLKERLISQAEFIWHCSNKFEIPWQSACAARLTEITYADKVFFCNSGAEANEGGLKVMRKRQAAVGHPERWRTIVFNGAFHGRTLATLAATDREDYRLGFGPTVDGFDRVGPNEINQVLAAISSQTAGILLEPIQGDGGIRVFDKSFVKDLRALATERDLVLMFDEIQTGVGRTGTFLASEQFAVDPDITSLAKGLGGGFPIGAVLATEDAARGMLYGSHGTTFGGNPLACAVADAVINEVTTNGFLDQVKERGRQLADGLVSLVRRYPSVLTEARGIGLMQGLKIVGPNTAFEETCLAHGLIVLVAADNVVRLLPPLTVTALEITEALETLDRVCACLTQ
ncbi:aspartate aminotransferase family protein [Rhizobium sp. CNPSo 4039]|uniref:aspartate aminotransferase family protein n=1 Tax=Rhizobium sp. CNPSo 4039 TaxID=3021409 RepID=UPI00254C8C1A|nr:aspartate aminotransferase family protein [Rhizobium sp. CNPSo 4039]MDK4717629.1 aspartate aminotransferase family protein [Rhizobium sp. CNPSo 4039]